MRGGVGEVARAASHRLLPAGAENRRSEKREEVGGSTEEETARHKRVGEAARSPSGIARNGGEPRTEKISRGGGERRCDAKERRVRRRDERQAAGGGGRMGKVARVCGCSTPRLIW
jgi:hypothetical protein